MPDTKFHQYGVWIETGGGDVIDPSDVFSDDIFSDNLFPISTDQYNYTFQFQELGPGQYHGIIVRTKDESGYVRLFDDKFQQFADIVDGEGQIGESRYDHVDFGIIVYADGIEIVIEVGFQTPGIGIVTNYFQQHLENDTDCEIKHETRFREEGEKNLNHLLNDELKKIEVSFSKSPRVYEDLEIGDELRQIAPENYRLKFEVSLEQGKKGEGSRTSNYISRISSMLGKEGGTPEESLRMIDFPKVMNIFRITGVEDGETTQENLADMTLQYEIDTSDYGFFDINLGENLCDKIAQNQDQ